MEHVTDDRYRGTCLVGERHAFGGHVAAHALTAAYRTVSASLHAHSMHGYFLRPAMAELPITYSVERVRDGRTFATRSVVAAQGGNAIFTMTASFKQPEQVGHRQSTMPVVPAPEELPDPYPAWSTAQPVDFARSGFTDVVQMRVAPADESRRQSGMTEQKVWLRARPELPDDPRVHAAALVYLSDLLIAATAALDLEPPRFLRHSATSSLVRASLDHAVWIHRPFRADDWLLVAARSPSHCDGRAMTFSDVWSRGGDLIASAAQETVIRPRIRSTS